jgi:hypothetical protein
MRGQELEGGRPRQRRKGKAPYEGQGPPRAVEPMKNERSFLIVPHFRNVTGQGTGSSLGLCIKKVRRQTGCPAISQFKLNQNLHSVFKVCNTRRALVVQTSNCSPHLSLVGH